MTGSAASSLVHELRDAGVRADRGFDGRSMKAQFKLADRSGARLAVVVGPQELEDGVVKATGPHEDLLAREPGYAAIIHAYERGERGDR